MKKDTWNELIASIAALGVPGLVLLATMSFTGFAGAAAITTALASLGGPFGMLGGIALLGTMALISRGLASYGFDRIFDAVLDELNKTGKSLEDVRREISGYPLPRWLVDMLMEKLDKGTVDSIGATIAIGSGGPLHLIKELNPTMQQIYKVENAKDGEIVDAVITARTSESKWAGVELSKPEKITVAFLDPAIEVYVSPSSSLATGEFYRLDPMNRNGDWQRIFIQEQIELGYWIGGTKCSETGGEKIVAVLTRKH